MKARDLGYCLLLLFVALFGGPAGQMFAAGVVTVAALIALAAFTWDCLK